MEQYIRVGIITSTHGLRGEVKVYPTTDDPKRFSSLEKIYLDEKHLRKELIVESARYFKQMVILKFKGIDSIESVEKYKSCDIFVDRENAVPLEEGEYYIADLIDLEVVTSDGETLGYVEDVLQTGANDVYIVKSKKYKEILIPAIPDCIKEIDIESGVMKVELLPGLLDL